VHVDASASEDHSYVDVGPWDVPMWPEYFDISSKVLDSFLN